jgi:acetyltransferase-like isoleucine patch superfamily enzyme
MTSKKKPLFLEYLFHGIFYTIYGIFKYFPSPLGNILRFFIAAPFLKTHSYVRISEGVTFGYPYNIKIGKKVTINQNSFLSGFGNIHIGNNVLIGHNVTMLSSDHLFTSREAFIRDQGLQAKSLFIADDVYIGCNVTILGGIKIGEGSILAAGSVVTKNVKAFSIVAGNPAKSIGFR